MTMRENPRSSRSGSSAPRRAVGRIELRLPTRLQAARLLLAGLLGVSGPLLVSCGSSGTGLIPAQNAGPLQSDFDAVALAAENGNGSCVATEEAILKTERDLTALPPTVNTGLQKTLREGITSLRADALGICKQSLTTTASTTAKTNTSTQTTPTTPTSTLTTPTTPTSTQTTPTTSGPGGGTPAPGDGGGEAPPGGSSGPGGNGGGEGGAHDGGGPGGARAGGGQEGGK
jgi:hypothetical protein